MRLLHILVGQDNVEIGRGAEDAELEQDAALRP